MAANLPQLANVEKLSTSIVRVLGGNPNKFTLQGTNTYLLGTGPSRMILDTAQGFSAWKKNLQTALESHASDSKITTCLLSHWHHDHLGGVSDLRSMEESVVFYKGLGSSLDPDSNLQNEEVRVIEDGSRFDDGNGFEVQAVHCPGHTKDHMAFLVTRSTDASEVGAIFTGDNVLGHGTAVFEDLAIYLNSLNVMKSKLPSEKKRAYPAHGEVIEDAAAKIKEYIEHRKMRENEALNVLKYGIVKKPEIGGTEVVAKEWKSMEMVKVIYKDVPEHLHLPAENGLVMVLEKLKVEGRVSKTNDGRWKVSEKAIL